MNAQQELVRYFEDLERQDKYSGVVYITQGNKELFHGAYGFASHQ